MLDVMHMNDSIVFLAKTPFDVSSLKKISCAAADSDEYELVFLVKKQRCTSAFIKILNPIRVEMEVKP